MSEQDLYYANRENQRLFEINEQQQARAEKAEAERDRLRVVRCPDGKAHRWDGDGMCLECHNYATDLIDAALQEGSDE